MSDARFDQYRLGPRFYRYDIVNAVANAVLATIEYSEDLEHAVREVSANMAAVDAMSSAARLGQVAEQLEGLERKIEGLVRYGWAIQREWELYVLTPEATRVVGAGMFPADYLCGLYPRRAALRQALACVRARAAEASLAQTPAPPAGAMADPAVWSTEYMLEKAKAERSKKRRADAWLDAVHAPLTTATDVHGRTVLHYAAQSADDVSWLKRLNLADVQALRQVSSVRRQPSLAARDVAGDSALTIAARAGNAAAVRYIVNESGVDAAAASLADAAVAAFVEGHHESASAVVERLTAFPDKVALVMRMSMFYGLGGLYNAMCVALTAAGARAYMGAEAALEQSARSTVGGELLHLATLGGREEMVKAALKQGILRSPAFNAHARDDAGLTALDIANYMGFRACADELLAFSAAYDAPVYNGMHAEHHALQPPPPAPCPASPAPPGTSAVFVTLGASDERRNERLPPLTLDAAALQSALDAAGLPRSAHLLLRIEAQQGTGSAASAGARAYVVDAAALLEPTAAVQEWLPPALLYTACPERTVLRLDLIVLADHALAPHLEPRIVAQAAVALPPTFVPEYSEGMPGQFIPQCLTGGNYLHAALLSAATGDVVGEANMEAVVSTPHAGRPREREGAREWLQPGRTLIYGHRGSGMNCPPAERPGRLQLGENTVLSMEQAARDGAAAVEFDVQLTRDLTPVVYHDWIVAETGFETPVNALALAQFMALNPRGRALRTQRSCSDLTSPPAPPPILANSAETVQAPFATMRELFDELPAGVGFDIEVKYPMPDEADGVGMSASFEINLFVDRILDVVYAAAPRPLVFTSFHPDICLLLAHKARGDFPIMLLTDAGMSAMADRRCNSVDVAVRLCKWAGLAGVVSHVGPIAQSPRVAALVRRHNLALATYGDLNNHPEHVQLQQAYGVDVVIADDVRGALAAVRGRQ
ncbi:Glycerophosphocholine phosphodiesterase [Coemansia biformis]|uniref:Glycerophosphocholine phosphodiesterase n=1 Tax=Coemansia biformis TaxID=1286918 RepID=A0A9W8D0B1_9FUNG|nr:Glycerophosphocholine phosphodiesterase [Coemansia biformis]